MSPLEVLFGIAALVLPVLTYFAGVQRGKRVLAENRDYEMHLREESDRRERIGVVAGEYVQHRSTSSNFRGLIKAGALTLENDEEIREACELVVARGVDHPIPGSYRPRLESVDLQRLLTEVSRDDIYLRSAGKMEELIGSLQNTKA